MLSGQHHPLGVGVRCQGAEAEVLRVRCKLVPFLLSGFSPLLALAPLSKRGVVLEQERSEWAPSVGQGMHWLVLVHQSELQCALDPPSLRVSVMVTLTLFR